MGWGDFLGGLMDKLPIQGRTERWKNELDNLQKEREGLLNGKFSERASARLGVVDKRIAYLVQLLKNKTS